ncbi:trifunctional dihydropteroate synthetase [Lambiella insularis]|nr:trifunctional dihydropteroate synthetase [Lambiella insularis]
MTSFQRSITTIPAQPFTSIQERQECESPSISGTFSEPLRLPTGARTYIALGSNVGDRIKNLESACRQLSQEGIRVLRTSALYETEPMYVENQNAFINGVCEVSAVNHAPLQLLQKVKAIENSLGRQKTIDKGPRNIDLDILLHNGSTFEDRSLSIPHKAMLEREFVLRPLCDLIPNESLPPSQKRGTFQEHLAALPKRSTPLSSTTPFHPTLPPLTPQSQTRPTHLMAILNLTPDSFSDGGVHPSSPSSLLPIIRSIVTSGATILDIGGQSTRPHAPQVSPTEELGRILPAIQMIRSMQEFANLAISVDTYRASVAAAAIAAGADIINDVSAGTMDPAMLPTAAKLGCTVVLMHMRGTPGTMNSLTTYPNGLITTVASELLTRVRAAEEAGIFRWRIMLDPGIGFAKKEAQNLEVLRGLGELRQWEGLQAFPWVVGASRKAFIGRITGVKEAGQRGWGTAGTVAAAVQGGADVVRVHDVAEMSQVVKISDAIWRV